MYLIKIHKKAKKFLDGLEENIRNRIKEKLSLLKKNPFPKQALSIKGKDRLYRIRVGKYRILYFVNKKIVFILKIDKRERIYNFKY